jgi:putative alpha-1,2-mannosidase
MVKEFVTLFMTLLLGKSALKAKEKDPVEYVNTLQGTNSTWKAQYYVRNVMDKLYNATENGYPGDEDQGQTSSWYVLSALGFYSVCPGTEQYVLGTPLFKKVTVTMDNRKKLVINAANNSADNKYVQSLNFNGKTVDKNWVNHFDLQKGGTLNFTMGAAPNKARGTTAAAYPYSFSVENPSLVVSDKNIDNSKKTK